MKTIGAALTAHLAGETTTLATLWKVTRRDTTVFGFTDHDANITYSGTTYLASSGFDSTANKTSAKLDVDNIDMTGLLTSATITEADLRAGLWDFADVVIMRVNYADLTMGAETLHTGTIGNVTMGATQFTAELRGMTQVVQQSIGRIYSPGCDADLGDARCGVSLGSFTVSGSVTSITSALVFTDTSLVQAAGYFDGGKITFSSGANAGYSMEVKTFAAGVVTLQQALPNTTAVSDTFSIIAGCDKQKATCISKFSNVVNFRGFEVPGIDRVLSGT